MANSAPSSVSPLCFSRDCSEDLGGRGGGGGGSGEWHEVNWAVHVTNRPQFSIVYTGTFLRHFFGLKREENFYDKIECFKVYLSVL